VRNRNKALASALYLFFYYLGSSVVGSATGMVWARGRLARRGDACWARVALALLVALRLRSLAPLGQAER
jgi:YNFM family putative membrane transporter